MAKRQLKKTFHSTPTIEGAGVYLKRCFGHPELPQFDPFLMFDDFSNTEASAYDAGFPTHPHRGMETVTYILEGEVAHRDSLGNTGSIKSGEVQWMTAGSGILHEEMPIVHEGGVRGFQLWVNLPQEHKMMPPRYQEIKATEIPVVESGETKIKIIAGEYNGVHGPVQDLMVSPTYLDVTVPALTQFTAPTPEDQNFFVYVFEGHLAFREERTESWVAAGDIGLLTKEKEFTAMAGSKGARFLLIGGKPLNEPIAWHGPIVMNTDEEIRTALEELQNGTFIKHS